jgi:large subunit ribosomal protein L15
MDLSKLTPAPGATKRRKRIGRGEGSGHGGTSTKGHKGQKARAGASIPVWFEGGQMPLQRRLPKGGFKNRNRTAYDPINLARLALLVEEGRVDAGAAVTPDTLKGLGIGGKHGRFKVLGDGELTVKLDVSAHAFSKSARAKIEAAGGTVTVVE